MATSSVLGCIVSGALHKKQAHTIDMCSTDIINKLRPEQPKSGRYIDNKPLGRITNMTTMVIESLYRNVRIRNQSTTTTAIYNLFHTFQRKGNMIIRCMKKIILKNTKLVVSNSRITPISFKLRVKC